MEEKNKKKRMLYVLLGTVVFLIILVGGTYAYFSASVSNSNTIGGNTQNINNSSLRLSVNKVNFNNIDTSLVPYNDLVPAYFGATNNELNVANPSELELTNVQNMIQNKCVNTSEGYTGCHVYKIAISADQDIAHANLLLGLTVNNHSASDVNVVDKSQWGYVVFTASSNTSATGVVGSGTQTAIADGAITNLALNSAGHGAPAAIGDGLVSSPTDNRIDIHNNQKLIGCNSAGLPQEVVYYLLVYVNDTDVSQNTSTNGEGNNDYAVGSYSGTLELQALGGIVRANFGPAEPNGRLKSRIVDNNFETGFLGNENIDTQSIANIYTVNHTSIPQNAVDSWDASEEQNGSVMAWITNADVQGRYNLFIGQVGGIQAPSNGDGLFANFDNTIQMDLSNLDMSNIGNYAFDYSRSLESVTARASDEVGICLAIFQSPRKEDVLVNEKVCSNGILIGNSLKLRSTLYGKGFDADSIGKVYTVNNINVPVDAITSWDASTDGDGSIMAWVTEDAGKSENNYCEITLYTYDSETGSDISSTQVYNKTYCDANVTEYYDIYTCGDDSCYARKLYTYNLYFGQVGGVKANIDSSNLFKDFHSLTQVDLSNLDASNVTDMSSMFENCYSLTTLNLGSSIKLNLINTDNMFEECRSLSTLDLTSFNMGSITNTDFMFNHMNSLTSITTTSKDAQTVCEKLNSPGNIILSDAEYITVNELQCRFNDGTFS